MINDWLSEIRIHLNLQPGEILDDTNVRIATEYNGPGINAIRNYRIYQALLKPLLREGRRTGAISDVLLAVSRKSYNDFNDVIVISEGLLTDPQMCIYDNQHLTNLGGDAKTCMATFFQEASGRRIGTKADLSGRKDIWIRPEKYFLTDVLLRGQDGSLLTESEVAFNGENGSGKYILPFREEILKFFAPEDIIKICRPEYATPDGGNTIIFKFSLPIQSNGSIREIRFERVYRSGNAVPSPSDGFIQEIQAPLVDIFPNYLDENWRQYYVFQSDADQYNVKPVNPIPIEMIEGDQLHQTAPSVDAKEFQDATGKSKQKIRITEIKGDNAFPEALEFVTISGEVFGIVLLQRHKLANAKPGARIVGVDFGTSNTNVYINDCDLILAGSSFEIKNPNARKWNLAIGNHFRSVTKCNEDTEKTLLHKFFMPKTDITLPFPTTLRCYGDKYTKLFFDYAIYFPLPNEYGLPQNVYGDIKWDTTTDKTEAFLRHLLFLIVADAVAAGIKELRFEYSFPKSYTPTRKGLIKKIWDNMLGDLLLNAPITSTFLPGSDKITLSWIDDVKHVVDEGRATGLFFSNEQTNPRGEPASIMTAAVCCDVGGGTTDIAVWADNGIKVDESLLIAGRDIAEAFRNKAALRHSLLPEAACVALEEVKSDSRLFGTRLNMVLRNEEKHIEQQLVRLAEDPNIQSLKRLIALEFGGIAYYCGLMTGVANQQSNGNLGKRILSMGISLYWGGNGARLLNWLDSGKYNPEGIACGLLGNVFAHALIKTGIEIEDLDKFGYFESPSHKDEVAGGIVIQRPQTFSNTIAAPTKKLVSVGPAATSDGIIHGENLTLLDGRSKESLARINEKDIYGDAQQCMVSDIELSNLQHCVDIINTFAVETGIYKHSLTIDFEQYRTKLLRNIMGALIAEAAKKSGERTMEPVFIIGVRELFRML